MCRCRITMTILIIIIIIIISIVVITHQRHHAQHHRGKLQGHNSYCGIDMTRTRNNQSKISASIVEARSMPETVPETKVDR